MNGIDKKLLIFVAAMGLVAVSGWFGRKTYKHASERRLIAEATQSLKTNNFKKAELCLRRAMQINPVSIPATKAMAEMLEQAGSPAAVGLRIRAAQLEPANVTNRFLWASIALKTGDIQSAEDALDGITGPAKQTAAFNKLSGATEWASHRAVEAEKYYVAAQRLEPDNLTIALNLDTIHLSSTNPAMARAARVSLEQLATNATWRLNALHNLEQEAVARKSLPDALIYSKQIAVDPKASFADKIDYLQLLRVGTNAEFAPWLASLEQQATNSPARAFALGRWMAAATGPAEALHWLEHLPPQIHTNQPVPLIVTDCKIALKDWNGLLATVDRADWGEAEFYRLALQALAYRSLKRDYNSQTAWRESVKQSRHRLDCLSRLVQATGGWGWQPENTELLQEISSEFPQEKWAANMLIARLYATGNTRELMEFLIRRHAEDPSDSRIKNNLATVYLLRKSELEKAYQMASEAFDSSPKDPFFTSTYAYSLLLQNKSDAALQLMSDLKPEYLQIPSIAAYYGVIQAKTGHKDLAKAPLALAETAQLLPEERELVQMAKNAL